MAFIKRKSDKVENNDSDFEVGELRDTMDAEAEPRQKAPSSRRLVLLILLLVLGGAGYVYTVLMPEPSAKPPQPAPAKKQAIAIPARPPAKPAPEPAMPTSPADSPSVAGKPVHIPVIPPAAAEKTAAVAPPAAKAAAEKVSVAAEKAPVAAEKAPVAAEKVAPASKPAAPSPAVAAAGKYKVEAGVFLLSGSRLQAEKTVRVLGYEPQAMPVKQEVEMVRLLVGIFPSEDAVERLQEINGEAPDAFVLRQGNGLALYAGSYLSLDRARSFADRLFQKGIRVEEKTVRVPMTMQRVIFGDFADQASAGKAAAKAKAAGLEAVVVRK